MLYSEHIIRLLKPHPGHEDENASSAPLILNRVAATSNAINDRFPVWKQAGALRHPHSDDPPPDQRDQLIGYEDATSSGRDHAPRPRRDSRRGALGARERNRGDQRSRGTRRESGGVGTGEIIPCRRGGRAGGGRRRRRGRKGARRRPPLRRGPPPSSARTNQPTERTTSSPRAAHAPSRGPHRHQEIVRTATPPTRYGRSRARG